VPRNGGEGAGTPGTAVATLMLALGVGVALAGIEADDVWIALPTVLLGIAVAGPALVRLLPAGTLRAAPGAPAAVAVAGLLGVGFFGAEAFVPLALSDVRGQSPILAGLPLTAATLTWTCGTWIQAREAPQRSRRALVATGLVLLALGVAAVAAILVPSVPATGTAIAAWAIAALGMGIAHATTSLVILESAAPGQEGERSAAFQLAFSVGIAVGTGAGGVVLNAATAAGRPLAVGIALVDAMAVAALLLALAAVRRVPRAALAPAAMRDAAA
jgi:predicted MFS family arabinose efflux permease